MKVSLYLDVLAVKDEAGEEMIVLQEGLEEVVVVLGGH